MSVYDYSHPSHRSIKRLVAIISLIIIFLIAFFFYAKTHVSVLRPLSTASPVPTISAMSQPVITTPRENALITSPVTISGSVPPGWMFEGTLLVSLTGSDGTILASVSAHETVPGTWQTNFPVGFTTDLSFTTTLAKGYLVVSKANPSGLPEQAGTFRLPIRFQK